VKKLPLFITLAIIVATVGGYFLYNQLTHENRITAWELVPSETILVYESGPCETCRAQLKNSSVLNIIQEAVFSSEQDSLQHLTDFVLSQLEAGTLISLHVTRKDDFDFIFYAPSKPQLELQFSSVLERLRKIKNIVVSERDYNGVKILELSQNK
jgi:hypothetical protein